MLKCLVVDDVEVTRFITQDFLNELDIEAHLAADLVEAEAELRKNKFDVVILDWHIGKEISVDLLEKMRGEMGMTMPVIMISGVEEEGKAKRAIDAGANDFLEKPTTLAKLQGSLQKIGVSAG